MSGGLDYAADYAIRKCSNAKAIDCNSDSKLRTVNDESLEGLKFGESAKKSIWRKKVWRISPRILVVYNISYMLAKYHNSPNSPNFGPSKLSSFTVVSVRNVN